MPQSNDNTTPPSSPKASSTNGTNGHSGSAAPAPDLPIIRLDELPAIDIETGQMMNAETSTSLTRCEVGAHVETRLMAQ
ncbi:hypothetical protein CCHR01_19572 [Colletotrichum chrysophilum]|uniref:Uncharacterized protein n=1 Tax=Colletotrichum chrysophilum TaxID=1836956 RepID=A0AAD8ZYR2_9PEZI|nr:hypothetical protein CCHR01_19572 [Colletotrichum chrysophilum]